MIGGGHVYFITNDRAIKIGWSGSPTVRKRDLQVASPGRLRIIATFPGTPDDEKDVHRAFAHLRMRGEWFRPEPDLLAFIEEAGKAGLQFNEAHKLRIALVKMGEARGGHVQMLCNSLASWLATWATKPETRDLKGCLLMTLESLQAALREQPGRHPPRTSNVRG